MTAAARGVTTDTIAVMRTEDVRAFVQRDRRSVEASKLRFWIERFRAEGWRATFDAGQALLEHARSLDPAFPSPRQRRNDLRHHLRLRRRLDRVAGVLAGR
jgi:hypothetical protein